MRTSTMTAITIAATMPPPTPPPTAAPELRPKNDHVNDITSRGEDIIPPPPPPLPLPLVQFTAWIKFESHYATTCRTHIQSHRHCHY